MTDEEFDKLSPRLQREEVIKAARESGALAKCIWSLRHGGPIGYCQKLLTVYENFLNDH